MLIVATDLTESAWLVYILEEFRRLSDARFVIEVQSLSPYHLDLSSPVLYYTREPGNGPTICNRYRADPVVGLKELEEDFYIYNQSECTDPGFLAGYDILWNAFLLLTRYEEYASEKKGKYINSYCFNHPRKNKDTFDIPMVNRLFQKLEGLISGQFQGLAFGPGQKPQIELSHDLDYIRKTVQLRIKQTAMNGWNTAMSLARPRSFAGNLNRTFRYLFSSPSYWHFDYWTGLESSYNMSSVFYVYAKSDDRSATKWLLDPAYDVSINPRLQKQLGELMKQGFRVGLHGSFDSAESLELLKKEKDILEDAVGQEVSKTRQHWLRYREGVTPHIHEKLFEFDSTLGWNDRIGFRSGCCSIFRPFDHENQKPFDHLEIPQVIMDSNIYDYGNDQVPFWQDKCRALLLGLRNFKNSHIALSWHPRVRSSDYNWHIFYEDLLKIITSWHVSPSP